MAKKLNKISIYPKTPEFARIEVISKKHGFVPVIIDTDDIPKVKDCTWHVIKGKSTFYCQTRIYPENKIFYLHRLIMGFPDLDIDHINHVGLDNRKSNLRICTHQENNMNRKSNKISSSKFKGVCWDKSKNKFKAYIKINKKLYNLGRFDSELDAALAYDAKALELFGEYAYLNFPEKPSSQ